MTRGAVAGVAVAAGVAALAAAAQPGRPVDAETSRIQAAATAACPAAPRHAELVVEGAAGAVAACVGFSAPELSGVDLVQQSGVEYDLQPFGSYGDAVCQLDGEPAQVPPNCFGPAANWVLSVSRGCGPWQWSSLGVSSLTLGDGDLAGFVYSADTRATPPAPGGECPPVAPPATAPPTPAPAPTASPPRVPTPTAPPSVPAHPGGTRAPTMPRSPAPGTPTAGGSAPSTPSTAPAATPTSAVAALDETPAAAQGSPPAPVVAGPLRRTGAAPAPPPAAASPTWAWVLAGLVAAGLVASLGLRIRRRRG